MDILEYILPDQAWSQSFHLETEGTAPLPVYVWLDSPNKRIWNMKGSGGYPWDMFTFDDELVYFSITENIYTLNTSFKRMRRGLDRHDSGFPDILRGLYKVTTDLTATY